MKALTRAFTGGEITPELFGYLGLPRFQTGLAKALNFNILPHGPAQNRAGFQYALEAKDSTRKVRIYNFSFSTTQTYILEFGHQYIRFFTNGAAVLESTAWNIASASYSQSFDVSTQETRPNGIAFSADGTKMYVIGETGDDVNEYDLSAAWDVSTAVYLQNFSVSGQDTTPSDIAFKTDGTKMYVSGNTGNDINEYVLSTAWDLSTAAYSKVFSVSAQDTAPEGLAFKTDGTKMYVLGGAGDDVNEYNLSVAWDIASAVYSQNFSVTNEDIDPTSLRFKSDGKKMYVLGSTDTEVSEYDLSTAWDVSTATYLQNVSVASQESSPAGLALSADGTKMYVVGWTNDTVYEYDFDSVITGVTQADPGVVSSTQGFANGDMVYVDSVVGMTELNGRFFLVANRTAGTFSLQLLDGTDLDTSGYTAYASGGTVKRVYTIPTTYDEDDLFGLKFTQSADVLSIAHKSYAFRELSRVGASDWSLSTVSFTPTLTTPAAPTLKTLTAWNLFGADFVQSLSVTAVEPNPSGVAFSSDGLKLYVTGYNGGGSVHQYALTTAWDISTASFTQTLDVDAQDAVPFSLNFKPDGLRMYVVGRIDDEVNEYVLSTAWDISTASYVQNFSVTTEDTGPGGLYFSPNGLKMYVTGTVGQDINEYTLTTAWDVSTASYIQNFSVATQDTSPEGVHFKSDGLKMYVVGAATDNVYEYALSTAWDISTAVLTGGYDFSAKETVPLSLVFRPDGLSIFVSGNSSDSIHEYALTGTPTGAPALEYYKCTAIASESLEESLPSAASSTLWDLSVSGGAISVDPPTVTGASRYKIYKKINGIYGYIGETEGGALVDNNIAPDVSKSPPEVYDPFSGAGDYPNAVGYEEGRRVFAGTNNKPHGFWLTASQAPSNLTYHIPLVDSDAIVGNIYANQQNRIRHILSLDGLIFLTAGGEWTLSPENAADILTPSTVTPRQRAAEGASSVRPLTASDAILYVHENQKRIMELKYRAETGKLTPIDVSVIAPHLFDGYTIVDSAYTKAPYKTSWWVRSDGVVLGMTYVPEYSIMAWHQHSTTNGTFESVAAAKEGSRDVLYAVIKRTINGRTVRYIERLADRDVTTLAEHIIVDSAISYTGAAATVLRGFDHLRGESVVGLDNGAVLEALTVSADGVVTLPTASSGDVHLGLGITADLQTLPFAAETLEAFGQGLQMTVDKVYLRVYQSSGMQAGPAFDKLRAYPARQDENYGSPPNLRTGVIPIPVDSQWGDSAQLAVRQTDPLPISVLSMTLEVTHGG